MRKSDKVGLFIASLMGGGAFYGAIALILKEIESPDWVHYVRGVSTSALVVLAIFLAFVIWNYIEDY